MSVSQRANNRNQLELTGKTNSIDPNQLSTASYRYKISKNIEKVNTSDRIQDVRWWAGQRAAGVKGVV